MLTSCVLAMINKLEQLYHFLSVEQRRVLNERQHGYEV